jgi:two-component system response regulator
MCNILLVEHNEIDILLIRKALENYPFYNFLCADSIIKKENNKKMNELIKPIDILLVEDNESDIMLTKEVLEINRLYNKLFIVKDGIEAMEFLQTKNDTKKPRPDLVLLDLNLPKKDGLEVLKEIKEDDELKEIPVIVMTESTEKSDVLKAHKMKANYYITKPVDMYQLLLAINAITNYYISIVKTEEGVKI